MTQEPRWVEWIPSAVDGEPGHRLMVVLSAPGCTFARDTGGCTNCSFPARMGTGAPVSSADLVAQLEKALGKIPESDQGPVELDIYNSGSFFNPQEIPPEAREVILRRIAKRGGIVRVLVESRPEYLTEAIVRQAVDLLGKIGLEIGIGLESADRVIREERIRKGFTWRQFEYACRSVALGGASLLVYVLLKPLRTSEEEAVEDCAATIDKVFSLGRSLNLPTRVALEPCFVGPGTELEKEFLQGRYRPPLLWSVIEVLKETASKGTILVGLSDEGLSPEAVAHSCDRCTDRIRARLAEFNRTRDLRPLLLEDCECRVPLQKHR